MNNKYVVIREFIDIEDENKTKYTLGNVYPRKGIKVSEERLKELSTRKNRRREILIVPLKEIEEPKKTTRKKVVKEDVKED